MRARLVFLGVGLGLCAAMAGCAGSVRVHPLATGQPDALAYELFGPSLEDLRRHSVLLCPAGSEELRASQAGQWLPASASRSARWADWAARQVLPPDGSAQLVVLCAAASATQSAPGVQGQAAVSRLNATGPGKSAVDDPKGKATAPSTAPASRSSRPPVTGYDD